RPVIGTRLPNRTFCVRDLPFTNTDSFEPSPPPVPLDAPAVPPEPPEPAGVADPGRSLVVAGFAVVPPAGQPVAVDAATDGHASTASGTASWSESDCTMAVGAEHSVVFPPLVVAVTQNTS